MSQGRVNFEVQLFKGGKWAINEVLPTEDGARRKADDLLVVKIQRLSPTHSVGF